MESVWQQRGSLGQARLFGLLRFIVVHSVGMHSILAGANVIKNHIATLVPTLRVVMHFVTLCITQRFVDIRWIGVWLRSPFRPSATYFDGAKVTNPPGSVSGPTSSGSFALSLIRGSPQRAIHGPVLLAWRPARLPPDQRQDSAVTYVAICVVCAIVIEKHVMASVTRTRPRNPRCPGQGHTGHGC